MLRCTVWRIVRFEKLAGIIPRGAWGLAAQLLIHPAAGVSARAGARAKQSAERAVAMAGR
jgi:hypothetical protein